MAECEICEIASHDTALKLYEDDKAIAMLHPLPCALGHIIVFTKKHYPIIEQIPDYEIGHIADIANKLSVILFENLGSSGTNIIINNGLSAGQKFPHAVIDVIPRNENDKLKLDWVPKKAEEAELADVEFILKENGKKIGIVEREPEVPLDIDSKPTKLNDETDDPEKNYLIRQLRRIP